MQGLIYMPTLLTSVALLFYKAGFYGSAHVQAMTLGYILKTNWQVKLYFRNIYTQFEDFGFPREFFG